MLCPLRVEYPENNYARVYSSKLEPRSTEHMQDHHLFPGRKLSRCFQKLLSMVGAVVARGTAHMFNVISPDMSLRGQSIIHKSCVGINPQIPFTVVSAILHSPAP